MCEEVCQIVYAYTMRADKAAKNVEGVREVIASIDKGGVIDVT